MVVSISTGLLIALATLLLLGNVYQYLVQRSALRVADILYIMSRNVRSRAAVVRRQQKDVAIVEAHLFDIATSARSLLKVLGRNEDTLGPDPAVDLTPNGNLDSTSLVRLADNIVYSIVAGSPKAEWKDLMDQAFSRFQEKVPKIDREGAVKILSAVGQQYQRDGTGGLILQTAGEKS